MEEKQQVEPTIFAVPSTLIGHGDYSEGSTKGVFAINRQKPPSKY